MTSFFIVAILALLLLVSALPLLVMLLDLPLALLSMFLHAQVHSPQASAIYFTVVLTTTLLGEGVLLFSLLIYLPIVSMAHSLLTQCRRHHAQAVGLGLQSN